MVQHRPMYPTAEAVVVGGPNPNPKGFQRGHELSRGKGRPKGSLNVLTRQLSQALIDAGHRSGDENAQNGMVGYLAWLSKAFPETYCDMLTRLLPSKIEHAVELADNRETLYPTAEEVKETLVKFGLPYQELYAPVLYGEKVDAEDAQVINEDTPTSERR